MTVDLKARALARWEGEGGRPLKLEQPSLTDPVCGVAVTEQSLYRHDHDGSAYFLCSEKCKAKLVADPLKYVQSRKDQGPDAR